jgi:hypothetical protein
MISSKIKDIKTYKRGKDAIMDNNEISQKLLEDSIEIVKEKKENENNIKATGENFNIFSILDIERKEILYMNNFISVFLKILCYKLV